MRAKILLVEDDPTIIDTLTELLRGAGYTVDTADTQREAIAMATHQTYQLLLLDVTGQRVRRLRGGEGGHTRGPGDLPHRVGR